MKKVLNLDTEQVRLVQQEAQHMFIKRKFRTENLEYSLFIKIKKITEDIYFR